MRPRIGLPVLLALALATAGCVGTAPTRVSQTTDAPATGSPSATPATPLPTGRVDLPEGPKEQPERPPTLNASAVREYGRTYEYRYLVSENATHRHETESRDPVS